MINTNTSVVISTEQNKNAVHVLRRGIDSGYIETLNRPENLPDNLVSQLWEENKPVQICGALKDELAGFSNDISQSRVLYDAILNETEVEDLLDASPYIENMGDRFQLLSSRFDEADRQEIISVDFDVMEGETLLMEDIWMRISWLSYHEEDASCRFRFSFGMENFDDVSTDPERQHAAAELSQRIFPESAIITENENLIEKLKTILSLPSFSFLERIIYFNAPNGGAQFHHDAEKGHLGVVYAQLTGETLWLAMSRTELINEITRFIESEENVNEIKTIIDDEKLFSSFINDLQDKNKISEMLNDPANEEISVLLNESPRFFSQLVDSGFAYYLVAGDIILLPQESMNDCAWHSVFCLGDEAGEALSFAIKPA